MSRVTDEEMQAAGVWVDPRKVTMRMIQAFPGYVDARLGRSSQPPSGKDGNLYRRAYKEANHGR